jgi:hypothetical protein
LGERPKSLLVRLAEQRAKLLRGASDRVALAGENELELRLAVERGVHEADLGVDLGVLLGECWK